MIDVFPMQDRGITSSRNFARWEQASLYNIVLSGISYIHTYIQTLYYTKSTYVNSLTEEQDRRGSRFTFRGFFSNVLQDEKIIDVEVTINGSFWLAPIIIIDHTCFILRTKSGATIYLELYTVFS
jgi:hypothetical protein